MKEHITQIYALALSWLTAPKKFCPVIQTNGPEYLEAGSQDAAKRIRFVPLLTQTIAGLQPGSQQPQDEECM